MENSKNIVTGVLDFYSNGYNWIRVAENYLPSNKDIVIHSELIKKYNLVVGDKIIGKYTNDEIPIVQSIEKINGENAENHINKCEQYDYMQTYPTKKLKLSSKNEKLLYNNFFKILELTLPIGSGQRCIISMPYTIKDTNLLYDIGKAIEKNNENIELFSLEIVENIDEINKQKEKLSQMGIQNEFVYSINGLQDVQIDAINLLCERLKRISEQSRNVLLLINDIGNLATLYNGDSIDNGILNKTVNNILNILSIAKNVREVGNITILANFKVKEENDFYMRLLEELEENATSKINFTDNCGQPNLDIFNSLTYKQELLLSRDEAKKNDILRKVIANYKDIKYTQELLEEIVKIIE